eukprot:865117-Amphidinium_carterae.1
MENHSEEIPSAAWQTWLWTVCSEQHILFPMLTGRLSRLFVGKATYYLQDKSCRKDCEGFW